MNFDPRDKTILFIGRRGSGKSVMCMYCLDQFRHLFEKVYVVSPSDYNHQWRDVGNVPDDCIAREYNADHIKVLLKKMEQINTNKTAKSDDFKRILIILDDTIAEFDLHHAKEISQIFVRGRHCGMCMWITAQHMKKMSPLMRNNADYLFLGLSNRATYDMAVKEWGAKVDPKIMRKDLEDNIGENHRFLLMSKCCSSPDVDEMFVFVTVPEQWLRDKGLI